MSAYEGIVAADSPRLVGPVDYGTGILLSGCSSRPEDENNPGVGVARNPLRPGHYQLLILVGDRQPLDDNGPVGGALRDIHVTSPRLGPPLGSTARPSSLTGEGRRWPARSSTAWRRSLRPGDGAPLAALPRHRDVPYTGAGVH